MIDRALQLAALGRYLAPPNPSVGCVIADAQGRVIGEGFTQRTGGPHAEVMALRDATSKGLSTAGATAYVTLEPCSHHGRTGPCCDALIAAGISKVVASLADPNPLVAGQGFARLLASGVEVDVGPGADAAKELNIGFFHRMEKKMPWVRLKIAASLDGKTALSNGISQWITSAEARTDGHAWRARACAVLTGIGTVKADDPTLDVRLVETLRQPSLIVVDSQLETPLNAKLFSSHRTILIYTASENAAKKAALTAQGATVIHCSEERDGFRPKVDLRAMLRDMARREINEVHVEAGYKLNGSLLNGRLVDELLVYIAPQMIGPGCDMAQLSQLTKLSNSIPLKFQSVDSVGPDIRILARLDDSRTI